ncbi:MAG: hypothetical protein H6822_01030 [Planctomycetaceae bacterium]|nr:hypothetical protein [Planctomycetales bacterium]MCB9920729.1 hypothetical protein [Planctomycetaceae bacterium]
MRVLLSVSAMTLIAVPLLAWADNDASKKKSDREKTPVAKSPIEITVEQEAAAVSLVQQHHKDLFELLIHLKEGLPEEYNRAIRDLSRANERLAQFEKRDPERYRIELGLWQAQSRRQLLTARLQMGYDASLLKDLRKVLQEEQQLELAILRHERERLAGRLAKIDEQITAQENGADASVERKFTTLTKAVKNIERNVSGRNRKPAAPKNTKDPA